MMTLRLHDKITGLLLFYFVVALAAIGSTLFVSWRLEGGAAAINDAGSERMRSYHIAFLLAQQVQHPSSKLHQEIEAKVAQFEKMLSSLEQGDPRRPLSLPKDDDVRAQMSKLRQSWQHDIKPRIARILETPQRSEQDRILAEYRPAVENFVDSVNELVAMVEHSNARATTLLRSFQIGLVSLALIGTILLVHLFSLIVIRPVSRLREGIQRMGKADFAVRLPVTSRDELGELADGFNRMADQLQDIYATLEQRVDEKTRSIEVKNRELAALDKEMAISEERNLLAQELHDSIAQSLAFLNIQVQMLHDDLHKGHANEALQGLGQIREGVQECYDDVRELLVHFRARVSHSDLETELVRMLNKFERQSGIKALFSQTGMALPLPIEHQAQVLYIMQEALSNVRKHARASAVEVEVQRGDEFIFTVRDNGCGLDELVIDNGKHGGLGMTIMRERAERIGSRLEIHSNQDYGTLVVLHVPITRD